MLNNFNNNFEANMQVRCVKTLAVKIRRVFSTRIFGKYDLSVPMESVALWLRYYLLISLA